MPVRAKATVRGGAKLKAALNTGIRSRGVHKVSVGFFSKARYPDKKNTPVTNVAAWNEYGTEDKNGQQLIPPRPFFKKGLRTAEPDVRDITSKVNPKALAMTHVAANRLGAVVQGHIQTSIRVLRYPKNADSTIRRKGSSNPLIDTGFMRRAVSYEIDG